MNSDKWEDLRGPEGKTKGSPSIGEGEEELKKQPNSGVCN